MTEYSRVDGERLESDGLASLFSSVLQRPRDLLAVCLRYAHQISNSVSSPFVQLRKRREPLNYVLNESKKASPRVEGRWERDEHGFWLYSTSTDKGEVKQARAARKVEANPAPKGQARRSPVKHYPYKVTAEDYTNLINFLQAEDWEEIE